jgi:hypothetical protein
VQLQGIKASEVEVSEVNMNGKTLHSRKYHSLSLPTSLTQQC